MRSRRTENNSGPCTGDCCRIQLWKGRADFSTRPFRLSSYPEVSLIRHSFPSDQHPQPLFPNPPQQQRRRMIHRQLSLPHPLPPNPFPHPPQQQRRRIIHRQEDIPFPFSHPHPQFVAVKSLMLNPPNRFIYSSILCRRRKSVTQSTGDNLIWKRISL